MFDSAQRNIHYLRLSVTDLCNLRCRYCMPDGVEKLEREAVLTYEEFLRLAALFARCGIDTVRVTGGEPLVRKGVDQLVAGLKAIPGIRKVTMTTNGILLAQQLPALLAAGLDSVNISLDTLRPEVFQNITARDEFEHVMEGIRAALDSGIPVKLNCVPQVGVNEGELEDLAALAESRPLQVRFIEMMPIGYGAAMPCISGPELRERFARRPERRVRRRACRLLHRPGLEGRRGLHRGGPRQVLCFLQPGAADQSGLSAPLPCQRDGLRSAHPAARRRGRRGAFTGHPGDDLVETPGTSFRRQFHARHPRDVPYRRINYYGKNSGDLHQPQARHRQDRSAKCCPDPGMGHRERRPRRKLAPAGEPAQRRKNRGVP